MAFAVRNRDVGERLVLDGMAMVDLGHCERKCESGRALAGYQGYWKMRGRYLASVICKAKRQFRSKSDRATRRKSFLRHHLRNM